MSTTIYVVTDIYEGELIEVSTFTSRERADDRFDAIADTPDAGFDDVYEAAPGDFRLAMNDAGRTLRLNVSTLDSRSASVTITKL